MKTYKITYYDDCDIKHSATVVADSADKAKSIGWQMFPEAYSIYVEEIC